MTMNESDEFSKFDHPFSLEEATVMLHELFTSLLAAGFTERQALIYMVESGRKP